MSEKLKFYLSNDEFVNEAISEIAKILMEKNQVEVDIEESEVSIVSENPVNDLKSVIYDDLSGNTHRRSTIARYYHAESVQNDILSNFDAFPDEHEVLGEDITKDDLEKIGISDVDKDIKDNVGQNIYTLNPYYTGNPTDWKTKRLDRYIQALNNEYNTSYESDNPCRCCSRKDLPNWKYDGEDIEYNQQFSHHITKSGQTSLGQRGSQSSNKRGRCVACLIAGFAYTLIKKPFYTTEDTDYRIFNVQGSFDSLVEIRKDYDTVLTPTDAEVKENDPRFKVLSSNIPTNARSDEGQILSLLSRLLESYTERRSKGRFSESELVKRVGGVLVFTSSNSKGGQPVRGISEMKRYNLFDEIYSYLKPVEYEVKEGSQSAKKEYRVGQFIESLSSVQPDFGTGDKLNRSVGEFSRGILNENSSQIESGLFGVAKPVINQTATTSTSTINILGGRKYLFMSLRNMTELTQEEIEALSSVGSSLGGIFDTRDDVSILISLKNANNAEQFLGALEKAGMEGMKKSMVRGESIESYDLVRNDNLEQTIKTFTNAEKFEQAKNVLVSHASLSALYNNVKSNSEGDQE